MSIKIVLREKATISVSIDDIKLRVSLVLGVRVSEVNGIIANLRKVSRQAIDSEWRLQRITTHRGLGILCIAGYEELCDRRLLHAAPIPTDVNVERLIRLYLLSQLPAAPRSHNLVLYAPPFYRTLMYQAVDKSAGDEMYLRVYQEMVADREQFLTGEPTPVRTEIKKVNAGIKRDRRRKWRVYKRKWRRRIKKRVEKANILEQVKEEIALKEDFNDRYRVKR